MNSGEQPDVTPLTPDELGGLKLFHVTTRVELNRLEQENINEAYDWAFRKKHTDLLTSGFICRLHEKMFGHVWQWAGQYRRSDRNIGRPWYHIAVDLKNLCDDVKMWVERQSDSADEMAVRLHHRLVSIHPFPNGNGRHARMMTDIFLEHVLKRPRFTWGRGALANPSQCRTKYISALKVADAHKDYRLLLDFVRS